MQLNISTSLVVFALSIAAVHGGTIVFYNGLSCSGTPGTQFRNPSCNYCYSPPRSAVEGASSVRISSILPDERWNIHTAPGCTKDSEQWQDYGPRCFNRGGLPPIRSIFIGCVGNKLGFNGTGTDLIFTGNDVDAETGPGEK